MKKWYPEAEDEMDRVRKNVERMCAAGPGGSTAASNYLLGVLEGYIKSNADLNTQVSDYITKLSEMVDLARLEAPPGMRFAGTGTMTIDGKAHATRVYVGPSPVVVR